MMTAFALYDDANGRIVSRITGPGEHEAAMAAGYAKAGMRLLRLEIDTPAAELCAGWRVIDGALVRRRNAAAAPTREQISQQRQEAYLLAWPMPQQLEAMADAQNGRPEKWDAMQAAFTAIRARLPFPEE